jgi:5-(carboxyamino)imidazole ribonucleotide mutase
LKRFPGVSSLHAQTAEFFIMTAVKPAGPKQVLPKSSPQVAAVGIIMGSQSDWPTMQRAAALLTELGVAFETKIVSAHRTPDRLYTYAKTARSRGLKVIIAGAGGAAHLPGMTAAMTTLPVLGVPIQSKTLSGQDSLLSIVQMPAGVPVGTLAIGEAGAANAGLLAAQILALSDPALADRIEAWRTLQTESVADSPTNGLRDTESSSVGEPVTRSV